jgi:hypothetical protein
MTNLGTSEQYATTDGPGAPCRASGRVGSFHDHVKKYQLGHDGLGAGGTAASLSAAVGLPP